MDYYKINIMQYILLIVVSIIGLSNTFCYVTNIYSNNILFCKNCKNFIPPSDKSIPMEKGTCKLFTDINLVTGEKIYRSASSARVFNSDCGKEPRYYLEKRKYVRKPKNENLKT
jgi:hypothetical protein